MRRDDMDVLVAGGGVAGLVATAAFAAQGLRAVCVDPVPPVTSAEAEGSDLRSTAFLMPAVELLARAGLWERLAPFAAPLRVMRLADAGGAASVVRTTADFDSAEIGAEAFGYNLPNWLLRREMVARLAEIPGAELRAGLRVTGLTPRTGDALVALSDGSQVRARLVVAADGRDSAVRSLLGINARRWGYGQKALVFTVAHALPHAGVSIEIHRTGGPFTLVPLPDRPGDSGGEPASSVVWMDTGPRAAALAALPEPAFNAALAERACGVLGAIRLTSPRRLWPIVTQVASRLDGPRTALVAEAAHVVPPIGAQGLNMSLADIATLLDLTREAADIGAPDLLARYHRRRHREILLRVAGIDALNRAAMAEPRPLRDLRRAGLAALHGITPIRRAAMRLGLGARRDLGSRPDQAR